MELELKDLTVLLQHKETADRAGALLGWTIASDSRFALPDDRLDAFSRMGFKRYLPLMRKDLLSTDSLTAIPQLADGFSALVDGASLLSRLDVTTFPLNRQRVIQTTVIEAETTAEGALKPTRTVNFDVTGDLLKPSAIVIVTAEVVRQADAAMLSALAQQLASAVGRRADVEIVSWLTVGSPGSAADVGALLGEIAHGAPSRPTVVAGFDVLFGLPAGQLRDLLAMNIRVLPTGAAQGKLIVLDAGSLAFADSGSLLDLGRHASVDLGAGSPAGPTLNLWQSNAIGLRGERLFRVAAAPGSVAWASVTGSPA